MYILLQGGDIMSFILDVIKTHYTPAESNILFANSHLLQYLEKKTKSVDRSSKARGSFANIYAIYVLTEDYIKKGYLLPNSDYSKYSGMAFTDALTRTRELPFGEKLQNHALNDRCNDEFKKFFHTETDEVPITRDLVTKKYWINESLLKVTINDMTVNIAELCIEIIDKYVELKTENFSSFFDELNNLKDAVATKPQSAIDYIAKTLNPSSDARIFEIVSYVILKYHYITQNITYSIGGAPSQSQPLTIFKVGRTNANDGGIDYIMIPLGRIFQVTEVLDFKKYFLDIDKLVHYPITFVVKQNISPKSAMDKIREDAADKYSEDVLKHYLECFEEIITIPVLVDYLKDNISHGFLSQMVEELIEQCKVEYNFKES